MGSPGTGKSEQLLNIVRYLEQFNIPAYVIDLEDKLEAMLLGKDEKPTNLKQFHIAFDWDKEPKNKDDIGGIKQALDKITKEAKPGNWIMVDRIDLAWSRVQDWFTQIKNEETLAELMTKKSVAMKKSSMFIPKFDQGSWQVINENYGSFIMNLLYKPRCNVLLTAGIRYDENSPLDIYGNLGISPKGQKELAHQPHGVFLLRVEKTPRKEIKWDITTGKDLPGRDYMEREPLNDFAWEYLSRYYKV